jgi:hypothetical protein
VNAVADTSVLISLGRLGLLRILRDLFDEVLVPPEVRREALEARPKSPEAMAIQAALDEGWLLPFGDAVSAVAQASHLGEDAAIRIAGERAAIALLDDRLARRTARGSGVAVLGTLGLLVLARESGLIPAVRPSLDELRGYGFRLSDRLIEEATAGDLSQE